MLKYSIVIPCYNVEKYLPAFLKNIPTNRTDFEIIFVDDGSSDDTLLLVKVFAKKNKLFHVISLKKNSGVSIAIQTGINAMKTNWYARLDPDDIVFPEYFNEIPKYTNNKNSLIRFKFKGIKNNKIIKPTLVWKLYFKSSWGWSCLINLDKAAPASMTRRINHDDLFLFSTIYRKNNLKHVFINKYLYAYRSNRSDSLSNPNIVTKKSIEDLEIAYKFYKNNPDITFTPRKYVQQIAILCDIKNLKSRYKKQKKN